MVRSLHLIGRQALVTTVALALSAVVPATALGSARDDCTGGERQKALEAERDAVLETVGQPFWVLDNPEELAALGVPENDTAYNLLDHLFASAEGMGIGIVDTIGLSRDEVRPGKPTVLLYAPARNAEDVVEPNNPDFPYRLVGWAYAKPYTPRIRPHQLECIEDGEWFVHERSIHPFHNWQNVPARPPDDEPRGSAEGSSPILPWECGPDPCPAGVPHPRLWDIHFWLKDDAHPGNDRVAVTITNERTTIPGWDPDVGVSFFYPEV